MKSNSTLTDWQKGKMKTSADMEVRISGHYSGNSYADRYRASKSPSKSPMRDRGYYSLDIRRAGSNIEKTKEGTHDKQHIKKTNLIEKLYKKDTNFDLLYDKRTPSSEDSV
jgi:hypothetical protein